MKTYDIVIIGGGPAGLTAAVYARRANKTVMVLEKATFGGQITYSPRVENIPGFLSVSGNEFAEKMIEQTMEQGAEVDMCEVTSIEDADIKIVHTDNGDYGAKAVIIATGAKHRLLGLPKEEGFIGNGISFCAVCDGAFYSGKTVGVVGGGNSALQEAILLAGLCKKVYVLQNLDFLTGEQKLQEQLRSFDNVEILCGVTVKELLGEEEFRGVIVQNNIGVETQLNLDGLFVAIGLVPQNEAFDSILTLDERGYATGSKCEGIFVAGDCCQKRVRQVTTAVSDGAVAAINACAYLDK